MQEAASVHDSKLSVSILVQDVNQRLPHEGRTGRFAAVTQAIFDMAVLNAAVDAARLNEIVRGRRGITADIALRLTR